MTPLRLASIVCSAVYLATTPWHPYPGSALIKGGSILLLACLALRASRLLLCAALVLSSIGDILLDLSPDFFVAGLGSFLLAHLTYVLLFVRARPSPLRPKAGRLALMLAVILYAASFAAWLIPTLGSLAIPVALYIAAITAMVIAAILARFPSHWVVTGAILFLISDSILAVDKFKRPVPMRDYLVWITYYAAQYAITTGLLLRATRPEAQRATIELA